MKTLKRILMLAALLLVAACSDDPVSPYVCEHVLVVEFDGVALTMPDTALVLDSCRW